MRCDAMRCEEMRCDAMRCDAMRCHTMPYYAMRCGAVRCDAMRRDAMLRYATLVLLKTPNAGPHDFEVEGLVSAERVPICKQTHGYVLYTKGEYAYSVNVSLYTCN